MKIVIIAGGKGTRIASVTTEIPKAMIPINNKPILEYQIELAKRYGFYEIIIVIGHLGKKIKKYFQDGEKWGVKITYYNEDIPLGTAGAIPELSELLYEDFFVFYGDTVMDIALDKMLEFHLTNNADLTLFLHPNDHPHDSDLVEINSNNEVTLFHTKPHPEDLIYNNLVNAALYIISPKILPLIPKGVNSDFAKDIFPRCLKSNLKLYGYVSPEYIKDMGTPERYVKVCNDFISGKVVKLNKIYVRPAVFLDRDGVICKEVNLLHRPEQVVLIEGVVNAVKYINSKGYLAVVVTNQPVIARNLCSLEDLSKIHKKLETLLGNEGAFLDSIYFCPHHPDKGYPKERKEFKIECECRKPSPGMLLNAACDLNIDLKKSYMIGDRISDIQAGESAGVKKAILLQQNKGNSLLETVKKIL